MTLSERLARELGEAFGDVGGTEKSAKVSELAAMVGELAEAEAAERKRSRGRQRRVRRESK
jgi:hypothetical protein